MIPMILPVEGVWLPVSVSFTRSSSTQTITVRRDGILRWDSSGPPIEAANLGGWNFNKLSAIGDQFEARLDPTVGIWLGSITGSWLPLSSDRFWICNGVPNTVSGNLHIRRAGSTVTLRSCPVSFTNA
jgi:hypothetical protein